MSDNSTNISAHYDLEYRTTMRKSKFVFFTLIRNLSAMRKKKRVGEEEFWSSASSETKFSRLAGCVLALCHPEPEVRSVSTCRASYATRPTGKVWKSGAFVREHPSGRRPTRQNPAN